MGDVCDIVDQGVVVMRVRGPRAFFQGWKRMIFTSHYSILTTIGVWTYGLVRPIRVIFVFRNAVPKPWKSMGQLRQPE